MKKKINIIMLAMLAAILSINLCGCRPKGSGNDSLPEDNKIIEVVPENKDELSKDPIELLPEETEYVLTEPEVAEDRSSARESILSETVSSEPQSPEDQMIIESTDDTSQSGWPNSPSTVLEGDPDTDF